MYKQQRYTGNYFKVPNAIFHLGLHQTAISVYAYLMSIEDRRTYECVTSYSTIARHLNIAPNTVAKYVRQLVERMLVRTERTEIITKAGVKRNGCLRYHILPIQCAIDLYHERQMDELERTAAQQRALEKAERLGVEFLPADSEQSA